MTSSSSSSSSLNMDRDMDIDLNSSPDLSSSSVNIFVDNNNNLRTNESESEHFTSKANDSDSDGHFSSSSSSPPSSLSFSYYSYSPRREIFYWFLNVFSCGFSLLFFHWFPSLEYLFRYDPSSPSRCDFVYVHSPHSSDFLPIEPQRVNLLSEQWEKDEIFFSPRRILNKIQREESELNGKMFNYRHCRYALNKEKQEFERMEIPSKYSVEKIKSLFHFGLSLSESVEISLNFGLNDLSLLVPSYFYLLVTEVFHPFFVFQIYSVILWCVENYFIFAICIFVISAISIILTLRETRERMVNISKLAEFQSICDVLRHGQWTKMDSKDLLPGDLMEISLGISPCDVVILDGDALVNESMLTGESTPVMKNAADIGIHQTSHSSGLIDFSHHIKSTIFAATKVVQLTPNPHVDKHSHSPRVVGMVLRTGWYTSKGNLLLSILYPQPSTFKFVSQSYKFVFGLFILAICGFIISVWQLSKYDSPLSQLIIRGLDLITIVVPPSLPLALSVGTNFALINLRKEKIFCISPNRINVLGKIRMVCLDKTGTITEEGMTLEGIIATEKRGRETEKKSKNEREREGSSCSFGPLLMVKNSPSPPHPSSSLSSSSPFSSSSLSTPLSLSHHFSLSDEFSDEKCLVMKTSKIQSLSHNNNNNNNNNRNDHDSDNDTDMKENAKQYETLHSLSSSSPSPSPLFFSPSSVPIELFNCLLTCHSLVSLEGEILGDPLEIQLFNTAKGKFMTQSEQNQWEKKEKMNFIHLIHTENKGKEEGKGEGEEDTDDFPHDEDIRRGLNFSSSPSVSSPSHFPLGVLVIFPFSSLLQRQSVIVSTVGLGAQNSQFVFCKGSPEIISSLCQPETLPGDYWSQVQKYAKLGYRVLSLSYKPIDYSLDLEISEGKGKSKSDFRIFCERELRFLGIFLLENKVKPESLPTLKVLHQAQLRLIMVTGDHGNTAVTVAKQCELVGKNKKVFLSSQSKDSKGIQWKDTEDETVQLNPQTLIPYRQMENGQVAPISIPALYPHGYELAMTGDVFHSLSIDVDSHCEFSLFHRLLLCCQIFSRMSPKQKSQLVEEFQRMKLSVMMCGDGANDVGALVRQGQNKNTKGNP